MHTGEHEVGELVARHWAIGSSGGHRISQPARLMHRCREDLCSPTEDVGQGYKRYQVCEYSIWATSHCLRLGTIRLWRNEQRMTAFYRLIGGTSLSRRPHLRRAEQFTRWELDPTDIARF